ncbi:MAG TPA: hypothetical protein ACFYD1_00625 [Candidatus Hypogeohydataceae bacterium YC38]
MLAVRAEVNHSQVPQGVPKEERGLPRQKRVVESKDRVACKPPELRIGKQVVVLKILRRERAVKTRDNRPLHLVLVRERRPTKGLSRVEPNRKN